MQFLLHLIVKELKLQNCCVDTLKIALAIAIIAIGVRMLIN